MTDLVKYRARYDSDVVAANVDAGDSDQQVTDYYNAPDITPDTEVRASREQVMEAIDVGEFKSLDAPTRDAVTLVLLPESVVIRGSNARAIILDAFNGKPATLEKLQDLQTELESAAERTRAQRGGFLGNSLVVRASHTNAMRAL